MASPDSTTPDRDARLLPGGPWLAALLVVAALTASAAPLLVYTVSLAAFGLPHVFAELRYVDFRFRRRLARGVLIGLLVWLGALIALRVADLGGLVDGGRAPLELLILVGLIFVAMWQMRRSRHLSLSSTS